MVSAANRRGARVGAAVGAIVVALVQAVSAATGCEQIVGFPERHEAANLTCDAGTCACGPGFDDCNHDLSDGCERPLDGDPENCGACSRSCLGGECVDGVCGFFLMQPAEAVIGPAVFDDRVYYVDASNGALFASPVSGELDFSVVRAGSATAADHYGDLFVAPDGLYGLVTRYGGPTRFFHVDASGAVDEPFPSVPWDFHDELSLVVTPEALFYKEYSDVFRVDRLTHERVQLTSNAWFGELGARGDNVYFTEGSSVYVVRPTSSGSGQKEIVFDADHDLCRVFPLPSGFATIPCYHSGLERWTESGELLGNTDALMIPPAVLDVAEHDGTIFMLDDNNNQILAWDGAGFTPIAVSQPFGTNDFAITWYDDALYWSSKNGILRIRL